MLLARFLHLLAAAIWVGGQITLIVAAPAIRARAENAADLMGVIGRRFGAISAAALLVLIITGFYQVDQLGLALGFDNEADRLVTEKVILVVAMIALSAVHGIIGARIARGDRRGSSRTRSIAIANAALGVVALFIAADLAT